MCTVSYLPLEQGCILTSNRDETPGRTIREIATETINETRIHFPRDPLKGGTWFAFAEDNRAATILNGADTPVDLAGSYPVSRGKILLDSFGTRDPLQFATTKTFEGCAPFRMLLWKPNALHEIIWNGRTYMLYRLDHRSPHFRSSVTLYPEKVRRAREALFKEWLESHFTYSQENIIDFHRTGSLGEPENDFIMNRGDIVKTLSITSVMITFQGFVFRHIDLEDPSINFELTSTSHIRGN